MHLTTTHLTHDPTHLNTRGAPPALPAQTFHRCQFTGCTFAASRLAQLYTFPVKRLCAHHAAKLVDVAAQVGGKVVAKVRRLPLPCVVCGNPMDTTGQFCSGLARARSELELRGPVVSGRRAEMRLAVLAHEQHAASLAAREATC